MSHVFISYSRSDSDFARAVRVRLQREGIPVWMDEGGIDAGEKWLNAIEEALDSSCALVVLMSQASKQSDWVNREIQYAEDLGLPIFPVLINGQPFFRLGDKQYEPMDKPTTDLSSKFITQLRNTFPGTQHDIRFDIVQGDVMEQEADVLVLKYAGRFLGADKFINAALMDAGIYVDTDEIEGHGYTVVDPQDVVKAKQILFIATRRPRSFDYSDVRYFAAHALETLQDVLPDVKNVVFTIHGVGFGLNAGESFRAQLGGILDSLHEVQLTELEHITIAEINSTRSEYLKDMANKYLADIKSAVMGPEDEGWHYILTPERLNTALGQVAESIISSVAVFFPPEKSLEDIFYFGILRPSEMQGFICESIPIAIDLSDEDDLTKAVRLIRRAQLVVAYVNNSGPLSSELILQLGMAIGQDKPVYILSPDGVEVNPPLLPALQRRHHSRISDLEASMLKLLKSVQ